MKILLFGLLFFINVYAQDVVVDIAKKYISLVQANDMNATHSLLTYKDRQSQPLWFYSELHSYPIKNISRFFGRTGSAKSKEFYRNLELMSSKKPIEFVSVEKSNDYANTTFKVDEKLINIRLKKNKTNWYIDVGLNNYKFILDSKSILITRKLLENWLFFKLYLDIDYNDKFYLYDIYKKKYLDVINRKSSFDDTSRKEYEKAKITKEFFDKGGFVITNTKTISHPSKDIKGVEISFTNNSNKNIENIFAEFLYIDEEQNVIRRAYSALLPPQKILKAKESMIHPYWFKQPKDFKGSFKIRPLDVVFKEN